MKQLITVGLEEKHSGITRLDLVSNGFARIDDGLRAVVSSSTYSRIIIEGRTRIVSHLTVMDEEATA